jgi:hypothetical protein
LAGEGRHRRIGTGFAFQFACAAFNRLFTDAKDPVERNKALAPSVLGAVGAGRPLSPGIKRLRRRGYCKRLI